MTLWEPVWERDLQMPRPPTSALAALECFREKCARFSRKEARPIKDLGSFRASTKIGTTLGLLAGLLATPLFADEKPKPNGRPQEVELHQDEALARLQSSEFKPLSEVLAAGQKVVPGDVVRVKVKRLRGRLVYELKIISAQGRVREVYVDPANLDIIKVE